MILRFVGRFFPVHGTRLRIPRRCPVTVAVAVTDSRCPRYVLPRYPARPRLWLRLYLIDYAPDYVTLPRLPRLDLFTRWLFCCYSPVLLTFVGRCYVDLNYVDYVVDLPIVVPITVLITPLLVVVVAVLIYPVDYVASWCYSPLASPDCLDVTPFVICCCDVVAPTFPTLTVFPHIAVVVDCIYLIRYDSPWWMLFPQVIVDRCLI